MDDETREAVRLFVYRTLARTGRAPSDGEIADACRIPLADVPRALDALADAHHLVLRDGRIVLAHPFATVSFGFSVMGRETLYWGGCAWDSFAIPNLVDAEPSVLVATTCPGCGRAMSWMVDRSGPPAGEEVVHFPTPAVHVWDDVVATCSMQRTFCDEGCIDTWCAASGITKGSVFGLDVLWNLASGWYAGRLDTPYVRRDPVAAKEYFVAAGLPAAFVAGL